MQSGLPLVVFPLDGLFSDELKLVLPCPGIKRINDVIVLYASWGIYDRILSYLGKEARSGHSPLPPEVSGHPRLFTTSSRRSRLCHSIACVIICFPDSLVRQVYKVR